MDPQYSVLYHHYTISKDIREITKRIMDHNKLSFQPDFISKYVQIKFHNTHVLPNVTLKHGTPYVVMTDWYKGNNLLLGVDRKKYYVDSKIISDAYVGFVSDITHLNYTNYSDMTPVIHYISN